MREILDLIKISYESNKFCLLEKNFKKVRGMKAKIDGITFIVINSNIATIEKSKTLHELIREQHDIFISQGR